MAPIIAFAQSLCRTIAPRDLADVPLYIVRQSQISSEFGNAEGCDGYTTPSLDLYLRGRLGNRWFGRGPCMVINDTALLDDCHPDDLDHVTLGVVLHEFAHILDRDALYAERKHVDRQRLKFESLVIADASSRPKPKVEVPAYFGHGESFIRTALHVRHRAFHNHMDVAPSQLCAGRRYGLSHAQRYAEALGDEPEQFADRTFREIRSAKPPPKFLSVWADDVAAYHESVSRSQRSAT